MIIAIPEKQYFKIGEVSEILNVESYCLEVLGVGIQDSKAYTHTRRQRLFHKKDLELLMEIKHLLYDEKFTIAGAKKRLQETKKRLDAEKKAKKGGRVAKIRGDFEGAEAQVNSLAASDFVDYREMLIEIRKELKDLRGLLEG